MATWILSSPVICNQLIIWYSMNHIFSQIEIIMLEVTVVIHHDSIEHTGEAKII